MRRLRDLAARHRLDDATVRRLEVLLEALAGTEAPTSVHDPREGVDVHVADSLVALERHEVREAAHLVDLGAGAGLPSLVLAAALPSAEVTAVESTGRKCSFIQATADRMGLPNVRVVHARAEEWREGRASADVVTARALAPLAVVCEYAAPLLRLGGTLVAWKGEVPAAEARDGAAAAELLGLDAPEGYPATPYRGSTRRSLYVSRKVRPTPAKFPRRSGVAAKRPLRANSQAQVEGDL